MRCLCRCVGVSVWVWACLCVQICESACACVWVHVQVCGCCLCRCVGVSVQVWSLHRCTGVFAYVWGDSNHIHIPLYKAITIFYPPPSLFFPSSNHLLILCLLQLNSLHQFAFGDSASDSSMMQQFVHQLQEVETHNTEYVKSATYISITHTGRHK